MTRYVRNTDQIAFLLDDVHNKIDALIPPSYLKAALSAFAAIVAIYLLQTMTWEAGVHSLTAIMRLVQRVSLGFISMALMLMAASIWTGDHHHAEIVDILFLVPFLTMLLASSVLVHRQNQPPKKEPPTRRPRIWMFGSRGPIR